MKKVLALVLAVVMVCTMAMAVTVTGVTTAPETTSANVNAAYREITPGEAIVFTRAELGVAENGVMNKDGTFAPEKNKVDVSFDKGSELIASKGWVKAKLDGVLDYYYVITTKASDTAVLDDTADIIINKVVVTKYGYDGDTTTRFAKKDTDGTTMLYMAFDKNLVGKTGMNELTNINDKGFVKIDTELNNWQFYLVFNYGRHYDKDNPTLKASATTVYGTTNLTTDTVLYPVQKGDKVTEKSAILVVTDETDSNSYAELKVGSKVYFVKVADYETNEKVQNDLYAKDATLTDIIKADTVVPATVEVNIAVNKAKEGYSLYMINADGSLKNLNAKIDDNGVLRATAKVTGPVVLSDKALTSMSTTEPGTTTNPGTGANDVVGVAAALAVVALVSGAAISLKK